VNAAWSWFTAGPVNLTFESRHWSFDRPPPNHLSEIPNPPVQPMRPSTQTTRMCARCCIFCSAFNATGRIKGKTIICV